MRSREEILRDAKTVYDFHADCGPAFDRADVILAAGSHDLRVPRHAAALFLAGAAPRLVCSGGLGKVTDGLWRAPEGDVFAAECRALGVPTERIIVERQARNTGENFTRSRVLLEGLGIRPETGIIVCKPYMAKRAWATAACQWGEVRWSVSVPDIPFEEYPNADCPLEQEIALMVGDLQRLRRYAERGFQLPVPVPEAIWQAGQRLAADGYDRYVIG